MLCDSLKKEHIQEGKNCTHNNDAQSSFRIRQKKIRERTRTHTEENWMRKT